MGIFGPTGSGKTVLSRVLARLESVPQNTLFIDDIDILKWPLKAYREGLSYVPQESFLFSDTIAQNVAFYQPESKSVQSEAVERASQNASIEYDIHRFPKNYDTLVGEKGVILSGGQKNRLALSRALYKPHFILILDDILSAVDHKTETKLIQNLFKNKGQTTSVLISHRVSALTHCDQILVLEEGHITDSGTHQSLLEKEGIYKHTWQYQKLENTHE